MERFGMGWDQKNLPIVGTVVVVDYDDECEVGLSGMQMSQLSGVQHPSSVDVAHGDPDDTVPATVYNAYGMQSAAGKDETGVRISRGLSDKLGLNVGDDIVFVAVDITIKPVRRHGGKAG